MVLVVLFNLRPKKGWLLVAIYWYLVSFVVQTQIKRKIHTPYYIDIHTWFPREYLQFIVYDTTIVDTVPGPLPLDCTASLHTSSKSP